MPMSVVYATVNGRLVQESRAGNITRYVADTLGSVIQTRDGAGNQTSLTTYWPFGEVRASSGTNPSPWGFCGIWGYYTDAVNTLYVRARRLRVDLSRWMTVDPIWPGESAYAYANGSPVMISDPTGQWTIGAVSCKDIKGQIIKVEKGDTSGVVGGTPPSGKGDMPLTGGADCTKGFKNAEGKDCICVNGSFFSPQTGWPVGSYKDCQGRSIGGNDKGLIPIVTGNGRLHGKPSSATLPRPNEKIGRTGACTDSKGNLLFLVVVDHSSGATAAKFLECMKSLCSEPNKIVMLDGSGSSQIWRNGKPVYPGDKRKVVNWIVICK